MSVSASVSALALIALGLAGCGTGHPPQLDRSPTTTPPTVPADPWGQLAARVATAQDHRYTASYTLTTPGRADRTVTVTIARDGTWLVVVPGGALGGTADVAVAGTRAGLYQCAVSGATPHCVLAAKPGQHLAASADPRVEYLFTSWLSVLTDRSQALAVSRTDPPAGAAGACFAIEANSTALAPPLDPGIYCYDTDGTMTAAVLGMGTFMLAAGPSAPPATVALPAPIAAGPPLPTASPSPPPSPAATG